MSDKPTHNNHDPVALEDALVREIKSRRSIAEASERMLRVCLRIWAMLDEKNAAYGNSALEPLRVFSRADTTEQLRVRIDDKLSRLARGHAGGEDVLADLMGYFVLLKVAETDWGTSPKFGMGLGATMGVGPFLDHVEAIKGQLTPLERKILEERFEDCAVGLTWRCGRCNTINADRASRCVGKDCLAYKPRLDIPKEIK